MTSVPRAGGGTCVLPAPPAYIGTQTIRSFPGSARPHVGLGVSDLARSRRFYEALCFLAIPW